MAYTYDVTTNRGKVRLELGDASATTGDTTGFVFADAEIDYFLTKGGSVNGAVIVGLQALIANKALRTKYFMTNGLTYDDRHQVEHLRNLLKDRGGAMPTVAVVMPAPIPGEQGWDLTNP